MRRRIAQLGQLTLGAHVHLSGICGTGMSAVAQLLKANGFYVTGSDKTFYPPMGEIVRRTADKIYEGYNSTNLEPRPAFIIIGNNLSRTNSEVELILKEGLPYASMPEAFRAFLIGERDKCPTSIVVTGTHGKTTTTAMIATMLDGQGALPGYFIGGVPLDLPSSIRPVQDSVPFSKRVVVLEGDEYDSAFFAKWPKFHSYRPDILLISSLEFDHADIYNSVIEIEREFTELAAEVPKEGTVLVCDTYPRLKRLVNFWKREQIVKADVVFYGSDLSSNYAIKDRKPINLGDRIGQEILLSFPGGNSIIRTPLTGEHNALNHMASFAVGDRLGFLAKDLAESLERFNGVRRRQELISCAHDVLLLEDFAHHPTAVWVTLEGLREAYPTRRIIAVFEPRSNTARRAYFQDEFALAFGFADIAIIRELRDGGSYSATSTTIIPLDVKRLVAEIAAHGSFARSFSGVEEIFQYLLANIRPNDLVVLMSNGDFGGLPAMLTAALEEKPVRISTS